MLRVVAHDGAGNETVAERTLGIDSTPPVIGAVTADFVAREIRVGVSDALAGVALAEVRIGGRELETRLSADGRTAIARVPAGLALDGAPVTGACSIRRRPRTRCRSPARRCARCRCRGVVAGGRLTGRAQAARPVRVAVWAYPKGPASRGRPNLFAPDNYCTDPRSVLFGQRVVDTIGAARLAEDLAAGVPSGEHPLVEALPRVTERCVEGLPLAGGEPVEGDGEVVDVDALHAGSFGGGVHTGRAARQARSAASPPFFFVAPGHVGRLVG